MDTAAGSQDTSLFTVQARRADAALGHCRQQQVQLLQSRINMEQVHPALGACVNRAMRNLV